MVIPQKMRWSKKRWGAGACESSLLFLNIRRKGREAMASQMGRALKNGKYQEKMAVHYPVIGYLHPDFEGDENLQER